MLLMGKSTISMVIFNSYVKLPEDNYGLITIKSPFSYGFPMVFQWESPLKRAFRNIFTLSWVNYNDLTVLPHWKSWFMLGKSSPNGLN